MTQVTDVIRDHAVLIFGDDLLALFLVGSYARGTFRRESDIDILLILRSSGESPRSRAMRFGEPHEYTGPEISPVVYTLAEFRRMPSFVLSLLDASRTLYSRPLPDGTDAAADCLKRVRRFVAENGIERVQHKGGYYWRGLPTSYKAV